MGIGNTTHIISISPLFPATFIISGSLPEGGGKTYCFILKVGIKLWNKFQLPHENETRKGICTTAYYRPLLSPVTEKWWRISAVWHCCHYRYYRFPLSCQYISKFCNKNISSCYCYYHWLLIFELNSGTVFSTLYYWLCKDSFGDRLLASAYLRNWNSKDSDLSVYFIWNVVNYYY